MAQTTVQLTPDDLREYQRRAIRFALDEPCVALFLDMGLGKTVSVLSVIRVLKKRGKLPKPVLLIGPIRVIKTVWRQEAAKWSHTRHLRFSLVHGSEKRRLEALNEDADIYLTNPENVRWLLDLFNNKHALDDWPFGMLVVDESSAFKAPGTQRFKKLRHYVHLFPRRIILTGTPTPNHLLELWAQMFIVDCGDRLGTAYYRFRERFFAPSDYQAYRYAARTGAERYIARMVSDVSLRLDAKDWLHDVPPTTYNTIEVELPVAAREIYDEFERRMFIELETGVVDAAHAATVSMRCQQIANGAVYTRNEEDEQNWEPIHDAKLEALDEVIDEAGSNVLIAYQFKHDLARLRAKYPFAPVFAEAKDPDKLKDEWNEGKHPIMLMHPRSGGHGLNLQFGGHVLVFFSLTWSLEYHDQLVSRIGNARAQKRVIVHYLCAKDTVDEAVLMGLFTKAHGQRQTLALLQRYKLHVLAERAGVADLLGEWR